jgi:hypothetical protein
MKWRHAGWLGALLAVGCGGESTETGTATTSGDAAGDHSVDHSVPDAGAIREASVEASADDRYIDIFDVLPIPEGPCGTCVREHCGTQINQCVNDPACREGLLCAAQMCAGSSAADAGPDLVCLFGCFRGDLGKVLSALEGLGCIKSNCTDACSAEDGGASDARADSETVPDASGQPDVEATADANIDVDGGPPPESDAALEATSDSEAGGTAD